MSSSSKTKETPTRASVPTAAPAPFAGGRPGSISLRGVSQIYGNGADKVTAVGPVDLEVEPGEFLVLVGASGCGKSTLLRLIAGFEQPAEGDVEISGGTAIPGTTAGVVFQQPRLFPWRTVGGNVDLALKYAGVPKDQRPARRRELLERVGLVDVDKRRIWEISGGQQQRVAIARALAAETSLLLLDEPFAALDALTRERLQNDLRTVSVELGRTNVFVTHSAEEAAFLGTRIVVLTKRPGRIALDISSPIPRTGLSAEELRDSPEYTVLRTQVHEAIKGAAE
ncbi:ABC transporter ATP-binding protein [Gordonia sp. (in: high G+C Gram-positive bacteria)]|jgi:taurine transport system ATP-binding protein|uniref:ABC transporter ATP-binding protein n=1 Tax=Gordonia sp. (in: high G+C Gram-positive bacteria) TaxID=84139 RepID=UPI001DC4B750|nr:ABC transporter ATP-binding protein [Gordonia sp. (in: high G+C Gram-positive bacteria)]MCB1296490.1 ABC transporter ATP-binding protein [Gordonia sp. (in: high G+C Gram-positive bacteria)]HMS75165.1 ABC transporter ATP-binding protein [Gordonia sp. (in: high G+C Gram-positive bacteria)]HQV17183.1 ABC transporter ATP-binding protein [Gordonia sp. (in: high G+C Gram-positive bacteria)]